MSCANILQGKTSGLPPVFGFKRAARWTSALRAELQGFSPSLVQNACRRSYYNDEIEGRQAGLPTILTKYPSGCCRAGRLALLFTQLEAYPRRWRRMGI